MGGKSFLASFHPMLGEAICCQLEEKVSCIQLSTVLHFGSTEQVYIHSRFPSSPFSICIFSAQQCTPLEMLEIVNDGSRRYLDRDVLY